MNKKTIIIIIASLAVLLGVAICVYFIVPSSTSLNGEDSSSSEYLFVTDEDGEIETDPDTGIPYVYVTDENGKIKIDESGEPLTEVFSGDMTDFSYGNSEESSSNPSAPVNDLGEDASGEIIPSASSAREGGEDVIGEITLPN